MKRTVWMGCAALSGLCCAGVAPAGPPQPATEQEIAELIASAGDAETYDGADLVVVLDEADVYVQDSGLATTESCHIVKVLTDAGVRSRSVLRREFDPATNRVTFKAVRIHRKDGGTQDVPVDTTVLQPAPQHWIYWGNQQKLLDIPRLEVGDCLEVRISKIGYNIAYLDGPDGAGGGVDLPQKGTGTSRSAGSSNTNHGALGASPLLPGEADETLQPPMPGHWYEVTRFQGRHPVIRRRYSVHMPADKPVQYEVYNGELKSSLWFGDDTHVYTFSDRDIQPLKSEPHRVAADDCATKVVMATVPDWEMKSRWFWKANESQFEADDAIRAKVAELTEGLTDTEDKIAALNHWVADNIRYYGTSRGPCEGFTLHTGIETFRDRGGVCKDKAGMLVTMLRVIGLEAYPALTMAGSRVEDIPADQFNHTVTTVRQADGTFRIYDPTWIPLSREMWSSREALQGLVYGTPKGQTLTLSPYYEPDYNRLECRSEARIDRDGALATRIAMQMRGYPCTYLRRTVGRRPVPERRAVFEQALNIAPNAHIDSLGFTEPRDYSRDGSVDLEVSAPGYAAGDGALRMFRLPLMSHPLADFLIPDLFYSVSADKRAFGMRLRATRLVRYEETLRLPDGWIVENAPEPRDLDSPSASLRFEATPGEGALTYTFEIAVKNQIIPPEDYPDFKKALETMKEITEGWVVCRVEEG